MEVLDFALGLGISFGFIIIISAIAFWYLAKNNNILSEILEALKGGLYFKRE